MGPPAQTRTRSYWDVVMGEKDSRVGEQDHHPHHFSIESSSVTSVRFLAFGGRVFAPTGAPAISGHSAQRPCVEPLFTSKARTEIGVVSSLSDSSGTTLSTYVSSSCSALSKHDYAADGVHCARRDSTNIAPIGRTPVPCTVHGDAGSRAGQHAERIMCDICERSFGREYDLKKHVEAVHLRLRPYECKTCGKRFGHKGTFNKHVRAVHLKLRPHRCPWPGCTLLFAEKSNVDKHVRAKHS